MISFLSYSKIQWRTLDFEIDEIRKSMGIAIFQHHDDVGISFMSIGELWTSYCYRYICNKWENSRHYQSLNLSKLLKCFKFTKEVEWFNHCSTYLESKITKMSTEKDTYESEFVLSICRKKCWFCLNYKNILIRNYPNISNVDVYEIFSYFHINTQKTFKSFLIVFLSCENLSVNKTGYFCRSLVNKSFGYSLGLLFIGLENEMSSWRIDWSHCLYRSYQSSIFFF